MQFALTKLKKIPFLQSRVFIKFIFDLVHMTWCVYLPFSNNFINSIKHEARLKDRSKIWRLGCIKHKGYTFGRGIGALWTLWEMGTEFEGVKRGERPRGLEVTAGSDIKRRRTEE